MIKVMLMSSQAIFRAGLKALLEQARDLELVGEAEPGRGLEGSPRLRRAQVVLLDLDPKPAAALELARAISSTKPSPRVLAITSQANGPSIQAAFAAGVWGLLLKGSHQEELVRAIRALNDGQRYASPELAGLLVELLQAAPGPQTDGTMLEGLPKRKVQVLKLVAGGKNTKEIAHHLGIADKTADAHRRALMAALGVQSVADLTRLAIRHGLVEL